MNQHSSMYQQTAINTSDPMKLVLMLYDGAIDFLKKALDFLEKSDFKNKNIFANRAREIILELNHSLDMEAGGEIGKNLRNLYNFLNRHLLMANWKNDTQAMKDVIRILSNLREGWQDAYHQISTSRSPLFEEKEVQSYRQNGFRI
jgi:flagellar protein FliS